MDIKEYNNIFNGLVEYNKVNGKPHKNTVLDDLPIDPVYPITIIDEIRNVANARHNSCFDRVSSIGYSIDIYAQDKGKLTKKQIAREIAKLVDTYMSQYVGLVRVGFIPNSPVNDNALHRITMTYSGNLHENRNKII